MLFDALRRHNLAGHKHLEPAENPGINHAGLDWVHRRFSFGAAEFHSVVTPPVAQAAPILPSTSIARASPYNPGLPFDTQ